MPSTRSSLKRLNGRTNVRLPCSKRNPDEPTLKIRWPLIKRISNHKRSRCGKKRPALARQAHCEYREPEAGNREQADTNPTHHASASASGASSSLRRKRRARTNMASRMNTAGTANSGQVVELTSGEYVT